MRNLNHLSEIFQAYDTYVIDLWGVMHNGISLNQKALEVIENLYKNSKNIVLLSNAPRPTFEVIDFLKKMNMNEKFLKNVVTSGEAAMQAISDNKYGNRFYHVGPIRDYSIFKNFSKNKTNLNNCDFILCTGLFDEHEEDLKYYKKLLKNHASKKMICTNPDLMVHRGEIEEICAGAVAKTFEEVGGEVIYYGKPYKEIYSMCYKKNDKVLAIGDNLRTDIRGANNLNIDSLFIYNGVHRNEFSNEKDLLELFNKYKVQVQFFQKELTW